MMGLVREVRPELLDYMRPDDRRAIQSRRDLLLLAYYRHPPRIALDIGDSASCFDSARC